MLRCQPNSCGHILLVFRNHDTDWLNLVNTGIRTVENLSVGIEAHFSFDFLLELAFDVKVRVGWHRVCPRSNTKEHENAFETKRRSDSLLMQVTTKMTND